MKNIIVTGSSSGLGLFLKKKLNAYGYERNGNNKAMPLSNNNVIIHTAFNSSKLVESKNINEYINDNILLTKKILEIPHRKFIYISTVDVYPTDKMTHKESDNLFLESNRSIYSVSKLITESIVRSSTKSSIILRASGMLGPDIRENSFIKILKNSKKKKKDKLTLNERSKFNYILQSDILELIKKLIFNNDTGIYNVTSNSNISLARVANYLNANIDFGNYVYQVGKNSNKKVVKKYGLFNKTSMQVVKEYIEMYEKK